MQVKNRCEYAKLIISDFFIPSQIKQKLFLLVVTCVGDCYCFCYGHGIFQNIL